ncbi:MAG: head GIN domain-containing protein [Rubrivivax sp.]
MKTFTVAAATFVASLVLTLAPAAEARVVGSGTVATETRAVAGFEAIAAEGSIDLVVRQAEREAVQVQAEDNLLPLVETAVETRNGSRTLVVRFKRGESIGTRKPVVVKIDVVRLQSVACAGSGDVQVQGLKTPAFRLALSGSGDARLEGLETESLELRVSGSGDVTGAGRARSVKVSIAGSGNADLEQLAADEVKVSIAGSGDASVTANQSLAVSVAGSGDVRYGGNATVVNSATAGSGSVTRR